MRSSVLAGKRARALRREMSPPEVRLWLRLKSQGRYSFRRQHPMGHYIVDFYCPAAKFVVEVDGASHTEDDQVRHDLRRDAWLRSQGLTVERIEASQVMTDPDTTAQFILARARALCGEP